MSAELKWAENILRSTHELYQLKQKILLLLLLSYWCVSSESSENRFDHPMITTTTTNWRTIRTVYLPCSFLLPIERRIIGILLCAMFWPNDSSAMIGSELCVCCSDFHTYICKFRSDRKYSKIHLCRQWTSGTGCTFYLGILKHHIWIIQYLCQVDIINPNFVRRLIWFEHHVTWCLQSDRPIAALHYRTSKCTDINHLLYSNWIFSYWIFGDGRYTRLDSVESVCNYIILKKTVWTPLFPI